ncbi:GNAT family N-acetyltransferase [Beijerinckia indica]|uniref:N-acetyltransferase domain-containing protein n=1 Tax=Beijerinckia indica subsp. indica (strain ATCC 9039 / DSM 1715 / NCIMB 8712) TaxID=395963 RepID=B2IH40_BEII9|nr:GNAT family N-acetyltransferase [Beijerinckia indica]ACB94454.1 conserved hypothetical protein [Beijerinckia indica subsp. indica ATCC 9039]
MHEVVDNIARHRFEMKVGEDVAFITYEQDNGRLILLHTEVPPSLGGRGIGSAMAQAILEDARRNGRPIVACCEFVASYVKRHPEYAEVTKCN